LAFAALPGGGFLFSVINKVTPPPILRLETQWHISCSFDCCEERDWSLFFLVYQPFVSKALTPTLVVEATNKKGGQNGIERTPRTFQGKPQMVCFRSA
jgi:hypothetical protein